jgi:hypothetical protein
VKESVFLDLDSELATTTLGWRPAWSQEQAIISTFKWWQDIEKNNLTAQQAIENDIEMLIKSYGIKGV